MNNIIRKKGKERVEKGGWRKRGLVSSGRGGYRCSKIDYGVLAPWEYTKTLLDHTLLMHKWYKLYLRKPTKLSNTATVKTGPGTVVQATHPAHPTQVEEGSGTVVQAAHPAQVEEGSEGQGLP